MNNLEHRGREAVTDFVVETTIESIGTLGGEPGEAVARGVNGARTIADDVNAGLEGWTAARQNGASVPSAALQAIAHPAINTVTRSCRSAIDTLHVPGASIPCRVLGTVSHAVVDTVTQSINRR